MAFSITFDTKDFEKQAQKLDGDAKQVPYALAVMLNNAAFNTRRVLAENTWPSHVQVRNRGFIGAALHVDKATKNNLTVVIRDQLGRGNLFEHAHGGTSMPERSRMFAVPIKGMVRIGAHGVIQADRPRNLISNNRRSIRVTSKGIFVGQGGRLRMMYVFKPSVRIPKDVPFIEDFAYSMLEEMRTGFPQALAFAMATARK